MPSDVERRALADADRVRITDEAIQALRLLSSAASRVSRKAARADLERAIDRLAVAAYAEGHAAALAALREPVPVPERGDAGAEAMRTAAAEVVRYRGQRARIAASGEVMGQAGNRAISDACAVMEREIRTIPLTTPEQDRVQGEGDGR